MRKFLLLPLFFFLAACGGGTESVSNDRPSRDEVFVETVRGEISLPGASDSKLVDMAHTACDAIDEGATVRDFTVVAIQSDIDPHDFGFFIGASIAAYCPENEYILG